MVARAIGTPSWTWTRSRLRLAAVHGGHVAPEPLALVPLPAAPVLWRGHLCVAYGTAIELTSITANAVDLPDAVQLERVALARVAKNPLGIEVRSGQQRLRFRNLPKG